MSQPKDENIIGASIGIYTILSVSEDKTNDGHKKYSVECNICGKKLCLPLNTVRRTKLCRHVNDDLKQYCLQCGKLIERKNLRYFDYKRKQFCDSSCAASYNNQIRKQSKCQKREEEKQKCKNCGEELIGNRKEYCNNKCQRDYHYKCYIEKWKKGEVSGTIGNVWIDISGYVRRYIFEKYGNRCARCGWSEINPYTGRLPLEVEHIDGDATNNKEENLTLLCPNCHSLTPTYRGANKGHGTRDIKWLSRSGTTNIQV